MIKEANEQILKAHDFLSDKNRMFIEYAQENSCCLDKSNFKEFKEGHFYSYLNLNLWPTFISKDTDNYFSTVSNNIFNLIKSIPSKVFKNDIKSMSEYYQIPTDQLEIIFWGLPDNHLDYLIGRGDFILDSNNELKCIEYNISSFLGGWQLDSIAKGYQNVGVIKEFIEKNNLKIKEVSFFFNLYEHIREIVKDVNNSFKNETLNIAYISKYFFADKINHIEQLKAIKESFTHYLKASNLNGCVIFCRYEDLNSTSEGVFYAGTHIHCILDLDFGNFRFVNLVKNKKVIILNGTITVLMCNKFSLSILYENKGNDVFSDKEKEIIDKYIPWSRRLINSDTYFDGKLTSLIDLVINNKEKFVLKKSISLGGEDVLIGKNVPSNEWEVKVRNAADEKLWIVQEFIKPQEYLYQSGDNEVSLYEAVFGLFTLGNKYSNGFVRLLSVNNNSGVINSKQGACESTLLVID